MILRQKAPNQFLFLVRTLKHDCSCRAKKLAPTFWWPSKNKIIGTQFHHKLILYSSWHIPRVLIVTTKIEQGTIRVSNEEILMITGALITTTVTQRSKSCYYRWYMFLLHWIILSSIHISYLLFVNSHPYLHITLLKITSALISSIVTQIELIFRHRWYLCLVHWIIQSLIHLSCPRFVNSHTDLQIKSRMSCKLLQYPVGLHLIRQIPCHHRPPRMKVAIFMDAWLMCIRWHRQNDNNMP